MGKPTGFVEFGRTPPERRPPQERKSDWREYYHRWSEEQARQQGGRCMDCAVPFCHMGCPLGNVIPDFNHQAYRGDWQKALRILLATNNFPEFTGRVCPAPCEASCTLSVNTPPVTIEYIEKEIADRGFDQGWIRPEPPEFRTGKKVAVIGSGPSGLATAQQLNRAGHWVTVFERANYVGGLLALGIPEFKLEKAVVQRRVNVMEAEGIAFRTGCFVGKDYSAQELLEQFDAICLTIGATRPRDLPVPGRELWGVHFAMEYLTQQNRLLSGERIDPAERISAEGKRVVILGGGDTGADCLGTAHRQGAELVSQFELLPEPPTERRPNNPWPQWPLILRTSGAHEEGGVRDYNILTKSFSGSNGQVERLNAARVDWDMSGRPAMKEVTGSEFSVDADLVLLAMGFLSPEPDNVVAQLGVELTDRGNIKVDANRLTSAPKVFAGGDAVRGQSLVVWAISEGRDLARCVDGYLTGQTSKLPRSLPVA